MSEIRTKIKQNTDGSYTITDAHSTADIVRWLLTQDSKETILYLLGKQRQWVGLTEEEVEACNRFTTDWGASCVWLWDDAFEEGGRQFVRAIEAKLKEKNT